MSPRVFVAGASGAIGRPLVRRLVEAGHEVTGMTRRQAAATEIEAAGARGVVCDVFEREALALAIAEARPQVLVHELTSLPDVFDFKDPELYTATNRVRTEGTRNLLAAAREAATGRVVAQSIAFVYAPVGGWVKDEDAPVMNDAPGTFGEALGAVFDLERQVAQAEGIDGRVLRYGFFYGPGTTYAGDGYHAGEVRRRRFPIVGRGEGTLSFIHVEDAASATVAAVERGAPGIYNVADDDPAPMRDWVPVYAEALGAKRPLRVPVLLARVVAGRAAAALATQTRGASNEKAKRELGWSPRHPSWRQGFREALG
ncbi:MAG: NAD-dependent epimerase/dehydratase family protein [Acidimicrobiia bacterium]